MVFLFQKDKKMENKKIIIFLPIKKISFPLFNFVNRKSLLLIYTYYLNFNNNINSLSRIKSNS